MYKYTQLIYISSLIFLLSVDFSLSFPVDQLTVSQAEYQQLNQTKPDVQLTNSLLTKALQPFFEKNIVEILKTDIKISGTYPNTNVQDGCSLHKPKVDADNNKIYGTLLANSYFNASIDIKWDEVEAIMNADLKAQLEVDTSVVVRERQKVFGHCKQIARDTVNLKLKSSGTNLIGVMMDATNIEIKKEEDGWNLEFDFNITIIGKVMKWNVDEFKASGGCKVKVLGFTILSFCGYVEKKATPMIQKYENQITDVDAPALLKKIQDKIQTAIGTHVKIPLKITGAQETTDDYFFSLKDILLNRWG